MNSFDDIRPYNDDEVCDVLDQLVQNHELLALLASFRLGPWARYIPSKLSDFVVRRYLTKELRDVKDVRSFQVVVARYMNRMIEDSTTEFTVSGLHKLDPNKPYLFMSNHRDITLDPAFTTYALYHNNRDTGRVAIGDNLLKTPYVSDLMRLNKSFIVNRSATGPRQVLAAYRNLSAYIWHSINVDGESIWLAQREGRAKDGLDKTEPAVIKMLSMCRDKNVETFEEHLGALNIVPVAISYEWDPCDGVKAAELYEREYYGEYQKDENEDVKSIGIGISGQKGHVHVAFGTQLTENLDSPEKVTQQLDRQVIHNYKLHSTNYFAYYHLYNKWPDYVALGEDAPFNPQQHLSQQLEFQNRIDALPEGHRNYVLDIYANAIVSKLMLESSCE
tara:strand:- start:8 stop:1177 length:1170 start_codon:yes stop_codon:yes gene_type:complete